MMQIFDEILKQYMQLALKNSQYKNNLRSLKINKSPSFVSSNTDIKVETKKLDIPKKISTVYYNYSENLGDIKDFYDKMEFDARRYNRNFDSQTGAFTI